MFDGLPILIVEDEPLLALDLADAVERFDGRPVGPAATVTQALAMLAQESVAAAILDANLLDRDVTPVALALLERSIPFVVHTALGLPAELQRLHGDVPVILKPAAASAVLAVLLQQMPADRGRGG